MISRTRTSLAEPEPHCRKRQKKPDAHCGYRVWVWDKSLLSPSNASVAGWFAVDTVAKQLEMVCHSNIERRLHILLIYLPHAADFLLTCSRIDSIERMLSFGWLGSITRLCSTACDFFFQSPTPYSAVIQTGLSVILHVVAG